MNKYDAEVFSIPKYTCIFMFFDVYALKIIVTDTIPKLTWADSYSQVKVAVESTNGWSPMIFKRKNDWEDQYDEDYVARAERRELITGSTVWIHLGGFAVVVAMSVGLSGLILGQYMLEKTLTYLACPPGIIWLLLMFLIYFALFFKHNWSASIAIVCWIILTFFGSEFVANQLIYRLEKPHLNTTLDNIPKLDVLFLLGGGTTTNLTGNAQVSRSGDRLVTAVRAFQAGKTDLIVCSGLQLFRTSKDDMEPHQESFRLLTDLNVPEENIGMIKGYNTFEEMDLIVKFLDEQNMKDSKIGIVTSAWHLSRAGRLAKSKGLDPVLVPSDFRSSYFSSGPGLLIPSSDALATSSRIVKEFLAYLVGR